MWSEWSYTPPDPEYLQQLDQWEASLTPEQQRLYQAHCNKVNTWIARKNSEAREREIAAYQDLGMEFGVHTPYEYQTALNMKRLVAGITEVRQTIEGLEANEQFEKLLNPPNV